MPYKDSAHKQHWERQHRAERIARRRALRQAEAARAATEPQAPMEPDQSVSALYVLIPAGLLAAYNPKLAIGAGSLTLAVAAALGKGRAWWILGGATLALGFIFLWNETNPKKAKQQNAEL